jgi:UDP-N-acetylglucosamine--N-acetylmuramyl-(pentapeptide) pyrophosphoryl-undecaprenol N-acetylglucosamine transferase
MKILFTGGGSGGHFYPIIAVAQKLNQFLEHQKIADVKFFYMSTEPYNERLLYDNKIVFKKVTAGKVRSYFSFQNFIDPFKMGWGVLKALIQLFVLYPDVVFSKGGFASFPALVAARFFRIPIIIHESDSFPGRVNVWAGKFAQKIAISYPEASQYFPVNKTALTGNPIRQEFMAVPAKDVWKEFGLDPQIPLLLILGGSQGAQKINDQAISLCQKFIEKYQVIHQAGETHALEVEGIVRGLVSGSPYENRYRVFGYLDTETMNMFGRAATLIVSRAGSAIFEIAAWGTPAVLIPIANTNGDHQRKNAFSYARAGGARVIEESNLTANILFSEIDRLVSDTALRVSMSAAARAFARMDAAEKIAEQIVNILIRHRA